MTTSRSGAGNGDGTFRSPSPAQVSVGHIPYATELGDLNGDGKPDLAVTNEWR